MGRFCRRIKDGILCMDAKMDTGKTRILCSAVWDTLILTVVIMCGLACFAILVQETSFANRDLDKPFLYDSPPWRHHWTSGTRLLHALSCILFVLCAAIRCIKLYYKRSIRSTAFLLVLLICTPIIAVGCTIMVLGGKCPNHYPMSLMCYEMGFLYFSVFLTVLMFTVSYVFAIISVDSIRKLYQDAHLVEKVSYSVA